MQQPQPPGVDPMWITVGVAVASLIVVPAVVAMAKRWLEIWRRYRDSKLAERFVPRKEMEMQFETLSQTQAKQHKENRDFLDTIRTEAQLREGRLLGSIESVAHQNREESRDIRGEVGKVHTRVDSLLHMLGDRRRDP